MAERTGTIALWLPRADEHALAASLGLVDPDAAAVRQRLEAARAVLARDHPGAAVVIRRWHVWRLVRALHRAGAVNTPDGRAAAVAWLERQAAASEEGEDQA